MLFTLDIGCGSGYYQQQSKTRGTINTDILKPKSKIKNFVLCDAHNLPFKESSFELIFFIDVIEHVENPSQCLREIKRVMKQKVFIVTPNAFFYPKIIRTLIKKSYIVYPDHILTFGIPEFTQLLNRIGFKKIIVEPTTIDKTPLKKYFKIINTFIPKQFKERQLLAIVEGK